MTEHKDVLFTYAWQPSIRVMVVDDVGNEYEHPTLGRWIAAQDNIFKTNGVLNRKQCKALWRHLGRTDAAPPKLWIMLNREDVMRLWPPRDGRP